jgi:hypothetical protein
MSTVRTVDEFLDSPCTVWDGTWREWFKDIILTLLEEEDTFSGKRPNCNSGWSDYLAMALAEIDPAVVEEYYMDEDTKLPQRVNKERYRELCKEVVNRLFR